MSHRAEVILQLKDLTVLKKAFESLGWSIVENSKVRGWMYTHDHSKVYPLVARSPEKGRYDVADFVIEKVDGLYKIHAELDSDFVTGITRSLGGSKLSKLRQQYAEEEVRATSKLQGHDCCVEKLANGCAKVVLSW